MTPAPASANEAEAELTRIQTAFAHDPRGSWEANAEALIARWPSSAAAGKALIWLGGLALARRDRLRARVCFGAALQRFPEGELAALAHRGLGDVSFGERHWMAALAEYDEALPQASPLLRYELLEKRAATLTEQRRFLLEVAAWGIASVICSWFAWRSRRQRFRLPPETVWLAPIYILLVMAAWGRDPNVPSALAYFACGSLALVTVAFAGRRQGTTRSLVLEAALVTIGNLAIAYIAIRRAGLIDVLRETLKAGAET
jgi:hypothetical protein